MTTLPIRPAAARFAIGAALMLLLIGAAAFAQQTTGVPLPAIPEAAKGTTCVRDPDFMRRNHMVMLTHKRDMTVHKGDRTPEFSLKECVTCHAVPGDGGKPVTAADPKHFCRACHDYAAVKVDCFECHASRPEQRAGAAVPAPEDPEIAAISEYLREAGQ